MELKKHFRFTRENGTNPVETHFQIKKKRKHIYEVEDKSPNDKKNTRITSHLKVGWYIKNNDFSVFFSVVRYLMIFAMHRLGST